MSLSSARVVVVTRAMRGARGARRVGGVGGATSVMGGTLSLSSRFPLSFVTLMGPR